MAKAIVHCRACGQAFDRSSLIEGVDWVRPSNRMYYHKSCYEEYLANKNNQNGIRGKMSDDLWFDAAWEYLKKDLKGDFNFVKVKNQWNSFIKKKMTAKGIYFSLKYFYTVRHNDVSKSENGIGIVPHIYEESCNYWVEREVKEKGICSAIEKQLLDAANQKTVVVNQKRNTRKKKNSLDDLEALMEMGE